MGTHGSFGILLEQINDFIYVSCHSDGMPENMGEFLLDILRTEGVGRYIEAMVESDLERVDHLECPIFTLSSEEEWNEWTFSEWIYMYRRKTESLLVCYPDSKGGDIDLIGKNPYGKHMYMPTILIEVPVRGTETVMDMYRRKRSLKRVGTHLTLYL